jgi:hypothetical protein
MQLPMMFMLSGLPSFSSPETLTTTQTVDSAAPSVVSQPDAQALAAQLAQQAAADREAAAAAAQQAAEAQRQQVFFLY